MRRGVNLGNALEAPNEGDWGYRIEAAHLDVIAEAGFDGVRLPVRWDQHMDRAGRVAPTHMARVEEVIDWAIERGLKVQLDAHHYAALIENPNAETQHFLSLWRQIAEHFSDAPSSLLFEPLNEPHGDLWRGERLTTLQLQTIRAIREATPDRPIILGPGNWQNIDALSDWNAPVGENTYASVHYYEPHAFTHQNAEWLGAGAPQYEGTWGNRADIRSVQDHIATAGRWATDHGVGMQLGEFGVNRAAPVQQRAAWARAVREACETNEIAWCVWDFAGAFPIWDRDRSEIIPLMRDALFAS